MVQDATINGSPYFRDEGALMPETLQAALPAPITTLTEDDLLFRDNVRQFADEKVRL